MLLATLVSCLAGAQADAQLGSALDTPGWEWSVESGSAVVTADAGANGGSKVVFTNAEIATPLADTCHLRIRYKGNFGSAEINGMNLRQINETVPGDAGTGWKTVVIPVVRPGTFSISGFNVELDSISAIHPPSDVAATLGIPGVTLRTGGGEPWKVAPDESGTIAYLAQALISPESPKTWFEFDVAGPAKIAIALGEGVSSPGSILVDVNGRNIWNQELDWAGVTIEVPAGNHVVRFTATTGFPVHLTPAHYLSVKSINIASISGADLMSAGIGLQEPVAYTGQWERRAFAGAANGTAIAGKANAGVGGSRIVKAIVTGPGYVQFRTHLPVMTPQQSGLHLRTVSPMPNSQSISRGYGDAGGWKDFPFENDIWNRLVWLPPGKQVLRWLGGSASSSQFSDIVIDDVTLTATPVLSVAGGSGAPGLQWSNDSEIPWTGYERPHDSVRGVASGVVKLGEMTELAVKVNGIGRLSYEWHPTGGSLSGWVKKGEEIVFSQDNATSGARSLLVDAEGETTIRWKIQSISDDEGWMDIRNVVWEPLNRKGLFNAWADSLPAGKRLANDDADGDGVRNMIEYAFGINANAHADKPVISDTRRGLSGRRLDSGPGGSFRGPGGMELPEGIIGFYDLLLPYVSKPVDVVVEISDNLADWRTVPVNLLRSKPVSDPMEGWDGWPKHGDTHQSVAIPITAADTKL
ncbi:MAG TPA: hypothetical protein VM511_07200, partial [Luteolibacter sp.]|nr:hypothetical protein [Luteolibacter sp.]